MASIEKDDCNYTLFYCFIVYYRIVYLCFKCGPSQGEHQPTAAVSCLPQPLSLGLHILIMVSFTLYPISKMTYFDVQASQCRRNPLAISF
jgi:hypothetical protein